LSLREGSESTDAAIHYHRSADPHSFEIYFQRTPWVL